MREIFNYKNYPYIYGFAHIHIQSHARARIALVSKSIKIILMSLCSITASVYYKAHNHIIIYRTLKSNVRANIEKTEIGTGT